MTSDSEFQTCLEDLWASHPHRIADRCGNHPPPYYDRHMSHRDFCYTHEKQWAHRISCTTTLEIALVHIETSSIYKQNFPSLAPLNLQVITSECLSPIFHGERLFLHRVSLIPCPELLQEPVKHVLKYVELLERKICCSPLFFLLYATRCTLYLNANK